MRVRSSLSFAFLVALAGVASAQSLTSSMAPTGRNSEFTMGRIDTRVGEQITRVRLGGRVLYPENRAVERIEGPAMSTAVQLGGLTEAIKIQTGLRFPGTEMDRWAPPDLTIAAGPDHLVTTTNMKIAFFRKDGTKIFERWLGNQETLGFFRSVGARDFTFDPKCLYDKNSGRFIVICPEYYSGSRESKILVAVSDDSDPNGTWYLYRTDSKIRVGNADYWVDYPGLGIDQNAIYVTGNLFGFSGGFAGALFRAYPISSLLNGGPITNTDFVNTSAASVQVAHSWGPSNAGFFIEDASTSAMTVHAIRDVLNNPTLVSTNVGVPSFSYPNSGAPQQGGGTIDVLDGRMMNAYWLNGRMVAGHGVRSNSGNRTVGRWYEFNIGSWPQSGSVSLIQSGNVDSGGSNYHMFPALAYNEFGDIGMVIGRSSSSQFAGVYTTGRKKNDGNGQMATLVEQKVGSAAYSGGRWGDYFGAAVDPTDGVTFWGIGEYSDNSGTWKSWVTSWRVATYRTINVLALVDNVPTPIQVTITPDGRNQGDGNTPLSRTYYDATQVTLEVPRTIGSAEFRGFFGASGRLGTSITFPRLIQILNSDLTVTVRYATP